MIGFDIERYVMIEPLCEYLNFTEAIYTLIEIIHMWTGGGRNPIFQDLPRVPSYLDLPVLVKSRKFNLLKESLL